VQIQAGCVVNSFRKIRPNHYHHCEHNQHQH
jgi:hypothetical protein